MAPSSSDSTLNHLSPLALWIVLLSRFALIVQFGIPKGASISCRRRSSEEPAVRFQLEPLPYLADRARTADCVAGTSDRAPA